MTATHVTLRKFSSFNSATPKNWESILPSLGAVAEFLQLCSEGGKSDWGARGLKGYLQSCASRIRGFHDIYVTAAVGAPIPGPGCFKARPVPSSKLFRGPGCTTRMRGGSNPEKYHGRKKLYSIQILV